MKYFLSFAITLIIISCSPKDEMPIELREEIPNEVVEEMPNEDTEEMSNEVTEEIPSLPDEVEIDINDDDIIDFVIDFGYVDVEPFPYSNIGYFGIFGSIDPSNNNQILTKRGEGDLFLREIEEIKDSVDEPLFWSTIGFGGLILQIYEYKDGQWQSEWQVSSNSIHSTYFVGLKINNNNLTQLGWVELDIDTSSGNVEVVNKGIL